MASRTHRIGAFSSKIGQEGASSSERRARDTLEVPKAQILLGIKDPNMGSMLFRKKARDGKGNIIR